VNPEDLLDALDPEQREAASSLNGPTCILAGAGTGKTRTITHRIAYGIAKGQFSANRVLALTYTNRAAGELRSRLRSLGIPGVSVKTFHAAALSQLEFFWPQLAGAPAPAVLTSKAKLIAKVAEELKLHFDAATIRDIAAEIEWRKYSMLSLTQYEKVQSSRPVISSVSPKVLLDLLAKYEDAKIKAQKIDWEDVLILTLGMLQAEPRVLAHVQQQYRFFTVDEYQDISPLQHALLDVWLGERNDICVVGDPNQTIYSFTGASSSYLYNFASVFPNATVIDLTRNYRSTGEIITLANRIVSEASELDRLESMRERGSKPNLVTSRDLTSEAKAIAANVARELELGARPSEVAILYRTNSQSQAFEQALAERGVDYQVRGGERFFNRPEIVSAVQLVRAENIVPTGKPLYQVVSDVCRSLGWRAQEPSDTGAVRDKWEALNSFLEIVDQMPEASSLSDFVKEIDERIRSQHEPVRQAVTLSTIHAAKGLEWDSVYLVSLNEGWLPIGYAKTESAIAEEKRLLYVGVTRARKNLKMSYCIADDQGRERKPSRFLASIFS